MKIIIFAIVSALSICSHSAGQVTFNLPAAGAVDWDGDGIGDSATGAIVSFPGFPSEVQVGTAGSTGFGAGGPNLRLPLSSYPGAAYRIHIEAVSVTSAEGVETGIGFTVSRIDLFNNAVDSFDAAGNPLYSVIYSSFSVPAHNTNARYHLNVDSDLTMETSPLSLALPTPQPMAFQPITAGSTSVGSPSDDMNVVVRPGFIYVEGSQGTIAPTFALLSPSITSSPVMIGSDFIYLSSTALSIVQISSGSPWVDLQFQYIAPVSEMIADFWIQIVRLDNTGAISEVSNAANVTTAFH